MNPMFTIPNATPPTTPPIKPPQKRQGLQLMPPTVISGNKPIQGDELKRQRDAIRRKWILIGCVVVLLMVLAAVGSYYLTQFLTRRHDNKQPTDTISPASSETPKKQQDGSSSTTSTPYPIMRMILSTPQINEITAYINDIRKKHNSPPMVYDPELSRLAQEWAEILALSNGDNIRHSDNTLTYGENIHYRYNISCSENKVTLINRATDSWYNEEKDFNYNQPEDSLRNTNTVKVGHFTCLVWKSSTKYGIGFVCENSKLYVVMITSPKPNTVDTIRENVSRPTS